MDVEDIHIIDIEADILNGYGMGKLSLEDIFDYADLPKKEEIREILDPCVTVKQEERLEENAPLHLAPLLFQSFDIDLELELLAAYQKKAEEILQSDIFKGMNDDKVENTVIEIKLEPKDEDTSITSSEIKDLNEKVLLSNKQINVNRKCSEDDDDVQKIKEENDLDDDELSKQFNNLNLSDTEKDQSKSTELRERGGPDKSRRHSSKRRAAGQYPKNKSIESSQFNSQKLLFLSGYQVEEKVTIDENVQNNQPITQFNSLEDFNPYSWPDDSNYGIASPDSGYATSPSSSFCGTSSPPLITAPIPDCLDVVDEQVLLESLAEVNFQEYPLPEINLSATDNPEDYINNLVEFLKDSKSEFSLFNPKSQEEESNITQFPSAFTSYKKSSVPVTCSFSSSSTSVVESSKTRDLMCKPVKDKVKKEFRLSLDKKKLLIEEEKIFRKIQDDQKNNKNVNVIYVIEEPETDKPKNQTNLQIAILNSNLEEIYSIVEIHKKYNKPYSDINIRDKSGKTALDYAVQQKMLLVINYLKENTAIQSLEI